MCTKTILLWNICNMQNTNYFQYWQFCFICHSNWGFMSNNETFSYLFVSAKYHTKTNTELFFMLLKKNPSSLFNDLFIKCSSCLRSALYFLITVNLFNMSIIDLFPQLNEIQIWPTKSIYRLKVFVWSVKSLLVSSHFVSGQLWTFSNLDFFSRGWERAELY